MLITYECTRILSLYVLLMTILAVVSRETLATEAATPGDEVSSYCQIILALASGKKSSELQDVISACNSFLAKDSREKKEPDTPAIVNSLEEESTPKTKTVTVNDNSNVPDDCKGRGTLFRRCITGDQPSYFALIPSNSDDQRHIEFFLSVKTPLFWWGEKGSYPRHKLYFGYTGKYDFYAGTRDSSPVISRLQNPGLFYKYTLVSENEKEKEDVKFKPQVRIGEKGGLTLLNFSLGTYHESNGQDINDPGLFLAKRDSIMQAENIGPKAASLMARDYISRSWNYVGLVLKNRIDRPSLFSRLCGEGGHPGISKDYLYLRARKYIGSIDDNFGWPDPNGNRIDPKDVSIADYNTFNLIHESTCGNHTRLSLSFTTGEKLDHVSYKLQITTHLLRLPITAFYFNGYNNNISSYYMKDEYVGVGLELW